METDELETGTKEAGDLPVVNGRLVSGRLAREGLVNWRLAS